MAVAAAALMVLEAFVGIVGSFDAVSDFVVLATAAGALSFLSSANKNKSKKTIHFQV